ncbi:Uncharacterised protein [Arachnia propionica]|uniref:Uncharacterized protein n=1 Tax=Arachnia propionica TaxID=1750 RepID=A0A3S4TZ39_9ACTN|nr:Uncharacterised protein [Arachnia propionica]
MRLGAERSVVDRQRGGLPMTSDLRQAEGMRVVPLRA